MEINGQSLNYHTVEQNNNKNISHKTYPVAINPHKYKTPKPNSQFVNKGLTRVNLDAEVTKIPHFTPISAPINLFVPVFI